MADDTRDVDPFGDEDDEPQERPEGYSVLRGSPKDPDDSPEAQGRRAFYHLRRIRQAQEIGETRRGALAAQVERLDADLARARRKLSEVDAETARLSAVDRMFVASWLGEAPQFHEPDRPRIKTIDFGEGLALESKLKTTPASLTLANEAELAAARPDLMTFTPKIAWGNVKKLLKYVPGLGVVDGDGALVPGVYGTEKSSEEQYFALVDGKRIALQGGAQDGAGTDGDTGDGADPFGDAADDGEMDAL